MMPLQPGVQLPSEEKGTEETKMPIPMAMVQPAEDLTVSDGWLVRGVGGGGG